MELSPKQVIIWAMKVKVAQSCLILCDPTDYTVHGIFQARILEQIAFTFSRGSFQPGIESRSPALQTDQSPAEPPGKPKDTGVGSLSLLQLIFLTLELNQGLLHCRWILHQLSYQGSPVWAIKHNKLKHNKFKRIEIIQCLLIDHSKIKLEMNNRNWKIGQPSQMEIKHHTSK